MTDWSCDVKLLLTSYTDVGLVVVLAVLLFVRRSERARSD